MEISKMMEIFKFSDYSCTRDIPIVIFNLEENSGGG
jgi:hypothetical protein